MLSFLFPRLTPRADPGTALFDALVGEARQAHWFAEGEVADSIDGRFAVLATILALAAVRLEQGAEDAQRTAVALTERFIEAMDAEHRQLGVGDPALGKTVRKLVGALAGRVEDWRRVLEDGSDSGEAVRASLFRGGQPSAGALDHCQQTLSALWARLRAVPDQALAEGKFG